MGNAMVAGEKGSRSVYDRTIENHKRCGTDRKVSDLNIRMSHPEGVFMDRRLANRCGEQPWRMLPCAGRGRGKHVRYHHIRRYGLSLIARGRKFPSLYRSDGGSVE